MTEPPRAYCNEDCPDEECQALGGCAWPRVRGWYRVRVEVKHAFVMAGYWVRPYNDLLDRRIWRWQKRPRCGYMGGRPWEWP